MRIEPLLLALALALVACSPPLPPHAPGLDATYVDAWRQDTGPVILPPDTGPRDSGAMDAYFDANVDAAPFDAGPMDAGPPLQIVVDGVFDDAYWTSPGLSMPNTIVAQTAFDGDALTMLHYGRDDAWFYLGFEATLVPGDAVVVYVDTHFGDGVLLSTGLGDSFNNVNAVLSLQITGGAEFEPEYGWGTSVLPHVLTTTDATLGWRALAATGPFTNITANTRSQCSATGCETAMLLDQIGVPTGGLLNFVVRLGRASGGAGFSNQTFPTSDTASPETIDVPVMVPVAP